MSLAVESAAQGSGDMKCQYFNSSNKADDLDQLCKLDVQSNFQSCAVHGQRISIPSWSNVSLSAVMVA
ncbi:hypothetical protein P692DRAFT_20832425, partial [Suillus brevipes Sb2]